MSSIQRTFFPGDEWLSYKIYAGPKTCEHLLTRTATLFHQLLASDLIDKFFFVRYNDPDYHLRIRFHLTDARKVGEVILAANQYIQPFVSDKLVHKILIDNYKRELERYGSNTIDIVENFFFEDSKFVVDRLTKNVSDEERWLSSISFMDRMMDMFGLSIDDKIIFCQNTNLFFSQELNIDKTFRIQLDLKYREFRKKILSSLSDFENETNAFFYKRSGSLIDRIKDLHFDKQLEIPVSGLLSSLLHMHFNRLFRSKQRLQEALMYYFIEKH